MENKKGKQDPIEFNDDEEFEFVEQAKNLDLNIITLAEPKEIVIDTQLSDRKFFKAYVTVFE
jgi:hypothetical protein